MEGLTITVECLRDLVAFHTERISGYEAMLNRLTTDEQHLEALFSAFVKQSVNMKNKLIRMGARCGLDEEQLQHPGRYGLAWSMVKAVFCSKMPNYPLDKRRSGENALLIAYHSVEGTQGLQNPVRLLANRQKREVIGARDWIAHFSTLRPLAERNEAPVVVT